MKLAAGIALLALLIVPAAVYLTRRMGIRHLLVVCLVATITAAAVTICIHALTGWE